MKPILALSLLLLLPAAGVAPSPYMPDANTLHLYHLDELAGSSSAANAAGGAAACVVDMNPALATPPVSTAVLGAAGYSGFGNAADFTNRTDHLLGYDGNGSGTYQGETSTGAASPDRIPLSTLNIGGASPFTLEALVFPTSGDGSREIIATDSTASTRGFQFRLQPGGSTGQQLSFNLIGISKLVTMDLPDSGPHAFALNKWFHAAFSYDGNTARFFWTRLDVAPAAAQQIGGNLPFALTGGGSIEGPLTFANEGRGVAGEGINGRIDEIRISNIARASGEFIFGGNRDTDNDGLADAWEIANFREFPAETDAEILTKFSGTDDPDLDGFDNEAEEGAGTDPNDVTHTPIDRDKDGLPDSWEIAIFNTLAFGPTDDPDNDGESITTELSNGSAANNRASDSTDTDADGLPDAWEMNCFATLSHNAGADPDGDRFSNIQELAAASNPADAASRPPGTAHLLVPIDDGNNATSEFGYGGSSGINGASFSRSNLSTVGNQQFIVWYGRHEYDSGDPFNNTIWIGRRSAGSSEWEVFRHPSFTANNITDGHDIIAFGIDGEGYMHLSWGMHGNPFNYARTTAPVTGSGPIAIGPKLTMTGNESKVTYPQFLTLPDGDLLYLFREGGSGNGDTYLNRYRTSTKTWENVHSNGGAQLPFIKGTGWSRDYNAYPSMPQLDAAGNFTLVWCGRESAASYQTNNNYAFARSTDGGVTWQRSNGIPYTLPISRDGENGNPATAAEHIVIIPQDYSLINQAGMCLDPAGNPVLASWWAPDTGAGDTTRNYMIVFRATDGSWQTRKISDRTIPGNEVRDLARPVVVCDPRGRIIVAYRDNADGNGLTIVHSQPLADDPDRRLWTQFELDAANLGSYEPTIDWERWNLSGALHFFYQPCDGYGFISANNLASRVSVLEWGAASYFGKTPQPTLEFIPSTTDVRITCPSEPSWSYKLWSSTGLDHWSTVATLPGTGAPLQFIHPGGAAGPKRFWKIEILAPGH